MGRTTIAIKTETRARLKIAAEREDQSIDGFLQRLIDEHENRRFWASFADVTPEDYAAAMAEDGDSLDEDFSVEDGAIDAGAA